MRPTTSPKLTAKHDAMNRTKTLGFATIRYASDKKTSAIDCGEEEARIIPPTGGGAFHKAPRLDG
jgi:hypothetical protein